MRALEGNSASSTPGGAGTTASGPTADIRPSGPSRTAPSAMGARSIGSTQAARHRSAIIYGRFCRGLLWLFPNGEWMGQNSFGSVPGMKDSTYNESLGQNGVNLYPVPRSISTKVRPPGRAQAAGV